MYKGFKYESIPLENIALDDRNPRIVTLKKLSSQNEILKYLYEHEDLAAFVKKIVSEGKNFGAERPYVIKVKGKYVVIEGNTRIAAYKVLTGQLSPPKGFPQPPEISQSLSAMLQSIDCSIAPDRDALLTIVANAHFGLGDKSKWGYLGSRKAVYDEWKDGKSIAHLAKTFNRSKSEVTDLILEYQLYLKALALKWSEEERSVLVNPSVEFNPPVRFLQTSGHKAKLGITYDKANLSINFDGAQSQKKFQHLVKKLVVAPERGLGATAPYDDVFADSTEGEPSTSAATGKTKGSKKKSPSSKKEPLKNGRLFSYPVSKTNTLLVQLMKEAKLLNCKQFPAAGTFLLRNFAEGLVKQIIHEQRANEDLKSHSLESAIDVCLSNGVRLSPDDKRVLKEFKNQHVGYLNLGSHANVIPNYERLIAARDCIDQFVKRNT